MIIDDHEVVRRGIAEVVERSDGMTVVAEAASVAEGVRRAELVRPQVLLVDLQLPDGTGIDIMSRLRESLPESRSIVLTSFDDDDALAEALEVGAAAYLLKSVRGAEIADVVRAVAAGRTLLDERTVDVHVGRLRKAVNNGRQPDVIRTIRGAGYAIRED